MSRLRICFHENPAFPWTQATHAASALPVYIDFNSAQELKAVADAEGLASVVYAAPDTLFPDFEPQRTALVSDLEEEIYELAEEVTGGLPDDVEQWPTAYPLLRFLTYWRPALMEQGAYLELSLIA